MNQGYWDEYDCTMQADEFDDPRDNFDWEDYYVDSPEDNQDRDPGYVDLEWLYEEMTNIDMEIE